MERQYIGARYVPKFADPVEWQNGVPYEPLTIVTYMGASYTSKKAVPAGVRPTDSGYWAVTGNYNAQVEEYRQTALNYAQEVETLKEDFNNKTGRDIIFIGDSYGDNPRVANTWCSACASAMGLSEDKWHNLCVSGASFARSAGNHYIQQLVGYTGDRNSVTDIVLMAGTNDIGSTRHEIHEAAYAMMNYIRANYPNAKAYAGYNSLTTLTSTLIDAEVTFNAYNSLGYAGYCVIPNMIAFNHNYDTLEDGAAHPDAIANNIMGWALASYLSGGELMYVEGSRAACTFEVVDGYTITGSSCITEMDYASAKLELHIGRISAFVDEPTLWTNDSIHVIGWFRSSYMRTGGRIPSTSVQFAYQEGGVWKQTYATIIFNNDGSISLQTLGDITPEAFLMSGTISISLINC